VSEVPAVDTSFRQFPEKPQRNGLRNWKKKGTAPVCCSDANLEAGISLKVFTTHMYISLRFIYTNL
jgi:hypothetical protein